MNDTIKEWYEKKDNVAEMGQWNRNGLKNGNNMSRHIFRSKHIFLTLVAEWDEKHSHCAIRDFQLRA